MARFASLRLETRWVCFVGALLVYAATRLVALEAFPIFFFCDEAIHSITAHDLIANQFRSPEGELLPTFFRNFVKYNLSLSVYLQGLTNWLCGETIWTVRATTGLFSLTGAAALAWLLKTVFRLREWWLGAMLLAVTPVWLVHSRTGFETGLMVTCYTWFLLFYCLYRERDPRWIFPAMLAGAGAFYAYANGQGVMVFSAALLLGSDARYHWRRRGWAAGGLAFAFVLFLPYLRFRHNHPEFLGEHLRDLGSFAIADLPLWRKVLIFLGNYLHGLDPRYWFLPGQEELVRHTAPGYPHLFTWLLPFYLLGLGICLRRWRESRCRTLLVALLAAPSSAALAGVSAYRALEFVVPANALIAIGLSWTLRRVQTPPLILVARWSAFAGLSLCGGTLLLNCLALGPTYSHDYGLYGMQWGSTELFRDTVPRLLRKYPKARVYTTTDWANGVNVFPPFFQLPEARVEFENIGVICAGAWDGKPDDLLAIPPMDLAPLADCHLFEPFQAVARIKLPDGAVGFLIGHLQWAPDAQAQIAALKEKQSALSPTECSIGGQPVTVLHPPFEIGSVEELFDGKPHTTPRCFRAIPMVIELRFPKPRALAAVNIFHRERTEFYQHVRAYAGDKEVVAQDDHGFREQLDPVTRIPLGGQAVDRVRIEVQEGPEEWVHLREITLEDAP